MKIILCSACLMGINCRFDGKNNLNKKILKLRKKDILIPVCPEQLGGLPTPREQAEIQQIFSHNKDRFNNHSNSVFSSKKLKIFTKSGKNVTKNFIEGAKETLKIAKRLNLKFAIFKQNSPSCGCGKIYDGTFSGRLVKGDGITTSILKKNGIDVISDEEIK